VIIEEYRDLSLEEWNFRKILQEHLENLLEKQRGIIKWACLGDENTKKNHANATIRHNKNSIMMLRNSDGAEVFRHVEKAEII
jgi:hypothetical protein